MQTKFDSKEIIWHKVILELLVGGHEEKLENLCLTTVSCQKVIAAKQKNCTAFKVVKFIILNLKLI
jgi:hypothetical protein